MNKEKHLKLVPKPNVVPFERPARKPETPFQALREDLKLVNRLQQKLRLILGEIEELKKE